MRGGSTEWPDKQWQKNILRRIRTLQVHAEGEKKQEEYRIQDEKRMEYLRERKAREYREYWNEAYQTGMHSRPSVVAQHLIWQQIEKDAKKSV